MTPTPREVIRWRISTELAHWRYMLRKLVPEVESCYQSLANCNASRNYAKLNGQPIGPESDSHLHELSASWDLARYLMEEAKYKCELLELLLSTN